MIELTQRRYAVEVKGRGYFVDEQEYLSPKFSIDLLKAQLWILEKTAEDRGRLLIERTSSAGLAYRVVQVLQRITTAHTASAWVDSEALERKYAEEKRQRQAAAKLKDSSPDVITLDHLLKDLPGDPR